MDQESRRLRVLFVGHARTPDTTTMRKWDALSGLLHIRVIVESRDSSVRRDSRLVPVVPVRPESLRGAAFYARLPIVVRREFKRFRPDAVIAQSPYDATSALLA